MAGADAALGLILRSACGDAEDDAVAEDIAAMRDLAEAVLADLDGGPELAGRRCSAPRYGLGAIGWIRNRTRCWQPKAALQQQGVLEMIDALRIPHVDRVWRRRPMMIEVTRALMAVDVNTGPDTSLQRH